MLCSAGTVLMPHYFDTYIYLEIILEHVHWYRQQGMNTGSEISTYALSKRQGMSLRYVQQRATLSSKNASCGRKNEYDTGIHDELVILSNRQH